MNQAELAYKDYQQNYNRIVEKWHQARTTLPAMDKLLFDEFLAQLPKSAAILDLGCGTGIPIAKKLAERGHRLTLVDCSESQLAIAKKILPKATFVCAPMESYEISSQYHGIVIWDSLFHLPRHTHESILRRAFLHLEKGGIVLITSGGSKEDLEPFTDEMFGEIFYYDSHPIPSFIELVQSIGFEPIVQALLNKPDGEKDKGRVGLILKKSS
ncbi:MAG: class I SAM-dependent methyltransferase [Chloroherpetonaceae bacterium]|nr:class I SAM-dependent methyltransferase [Chloroherpetonaceae bacterium]